MTELKWYKVSGIHFENNVQNGTQLKLKNAVKYNVNYFGEEKRCAGKLDFTVSDEQMQPFEIRIQMEAVFTYDEGDNRADIHVDSFAQLFPFLRQVISGVTSMSGMPALMIPFMRLNRDSVNINNAGEEESSPLN